MRVTATRREPYQANAQLQNRAAIKNRLDEEIEVGLEQLKRGEKIPGDQVYAEIRERSRQRRA